MKTITTPEQYQTALAKLNAYEQAATAWRTANKTNGIPAEVCATFPHANEVDNDLRSAIEVYEFCQFPLPDKYFLYINESKGIATTWTGQNLGSVEFGREYRDSFGGRRQSVRVKAVNGLQYHGTYYKSSGNYARIKMYK